MDVSQFDFHLPESLIAQTPLEDREASRLMVLNTKDESIYHRHFSDILDYLSAGDCLVINNTKVIPARLFGVKDPTGAKVELLLLKQKENDSWECLVKPAKRVKVGTRVSFGDGKLMAECTAEMDEGRRLLTFHYDGIFNEILDELGSMPLPPYIKEQLEDADRYQTVYAEHRGSAAAPTAGLHFTENLMHRAKDEGIEIVPVTLHVGLGTFRPVKADRVEDHHMHAEYYMMSAETADTLNRVKKDGGKVVAVGTTAIRTLESIANDEGVFREASGWTSIFIYPGYTFKAVDALITNFHLPKSSLIMLVSAFASRSFILKAYNEAVHEQYRFFSFGDAMFIQKGTG